MLGAWARGGGGAGSENPNGHGIQRPEGPGRHHGFSRITDPPGREASGKFFSGTCLVAAELSAAVEATIARDYHPGTTQLISALFLAHRPPSLS